MIPNTPAAEITLPIRVRISDGARLAPTEGDIRETAVWCDGAADGRSEAFRKRYAHKLADLKEKKDILKSKRKEQDDA